MFILNTLLHNFTQRSAFTWIVKVSAHFIPSLIFFNSANYFKNNKTATEINGSFLSKIIFDRLTLKRIWRLLTQRCSFKNTDGFMMCIRLMANS